ncbi:hypothetical protein [Tahibacter aquaticus]|uniref:hypothetical protein n=1 Tax=Tahibacter aquaticus TaxID=520092 RepID=UPI00105CA6FE|nr:hypothetical protein [Tahibacter aquaticus]
MTNAENIRSYGGFSLRQEPVFGLSMVFQNWQTRKNNEVLPWSILLMAFRCGSRDRERARKQFIRAWEFEFSGHGARGCAAFWREALPGAAVA